MTPLAHLPWMSEPVACGEAGHVRGRQASLRGGGMERGAGQDRWRGLAACHAKLAVESRSTPDVRRTFCSTWGFSIGTCKADPNADRC